MFTTHLRIQEESSAEGKTLSEAVAKAGSEMRVIRIERGEGMYVTTFPDTKLKAGDRLLLTDTPQNLKTYEQALGGTLFSGATAVDEEHPLTAEDQQVSEIVVVDGSPIEGVTLKSARFMERYQLVALALHRAGKPMAALGSGLGDVFLVAGDVLLVQGPAEQDRGLSSVTPGAPISQCISVCSEGANNAVLSHLANASKGSTRSQLSS